MITPNQTPTCFLIDDDDDELYYVRDALSTIDSRFTCMRAKDGEEGLKVLATGNVLPEFIFLDLNMPRMAGTECLIHLRRLANLASTPIYIYTTAQCSATLIENMISSGATNVFVKPTRMQELVSLIKALLPISTCKLPTN